MLSYKSYRLKTVFKHASININKEIFYRENFDSAKIFMKITTSTARAENPRSD